jgi:DNA-binding transcriptional LysR family regulator
MMNLNQLTTFVTVISEGSMTAAAAKLFLTQPAVSQQIRNLEEDLGVELLVRGVRQIKATPQGEILAEYAKKILQQAHLAENAVKSMGAELKGNLRIGTLNSLGLQLMSPIISRLMRHSPDLLVKVDYQKGEELLKGFKKGQYDVLIMPEVETQFATAMEAGVDGKFVMKEEMWLVGSGKDSQIPQQINISEINQLPLVHFIDEYPDFLKTLDTKLKANGVTIRPVFESANVGTLKRVIEAGLGWGFLPAHSIKKQVRAGRFTRTHVVGFEYLMDLEFYSKRNSENKMLIESFYQALVQQERG